jgi:hypothetical protein
VRQSMSHRSHQVRIALSIIYLAIVLLVVISYGASAEIKGATDGASTGDSSNIDLGISGNETADVLVQNWRGFATKDDETHPVRLNVETIMAVDPNEARRLLASNISPKEIRSQVRAGNRNVIQRGNIRLNNDGYRLIDIVLKPSGNRSVLEASLASSMSASGSGDMSSAVGHTVLIISGVDDMEVAEGYLTIDDPKYSGNYSLSLNEWSGRGPRAGPRWAMGN